jgi:hypothetical protein
VVDGEAVWTDRATAGPQTVGGREWWRCPRRPILDDPRWFVEVLREVRAFRNGRYQIDGGVGRQPNKLVEAVEVVERQLTECDAIKDGRRHDMAVLKAKMGEG